MEVWESIFTSRYAWNSYKEYCDHTADLFLSDVGIPDKLFTEQELREVFYSRQMILGGRYAANIRSPKDKRQISNCFCLRVEDTRESWAKCLHDVAMLTLYGGGVGVDVSNLRPYGSEIGSTKGQIAGGPCSYLRAQDCMVHELRSCRRGALLGQLVWSHPDIHEFLDLKRGNGAMQRTNISIKYDARWHQIMDEGPVHPEYRKAWEVFKRNVQYAVTYGEPGFSFNGRPGYTSCELTNPCAELRSSESYDSCNIGGLHINHLSASYDMKEVLASLPNATKLLAYSLLAGAKVSMLAVPECEAVRKTQNKILASVSDLFPFYCMVGESNYRKFMSDFQAGIKFWANVFSPKLGLAYPTGYIGIVPSGTGQLIAENCGGISEPYSEAVVRKIMQQDGSLRPKYEVKIDPSFKKCLDLGVRIPTSQTITLEESLNFQAMTQDYVDMGISKTIHLPARGTPGNDRDVEDIARMILKYHRRLAGLTFYPDAAIEGQPLNAITYEQAQQFLKGSDCVLLEDTESLLAISNLVCKGGQCGS